MVGRRVALGFLIAAALVVAVAGVGGRLYDSIPGLGAAASAAPGPDGFVPIDLAIPSIGVVAPVFGKPTESQWDPFLQRDVPSFGLPDDLTSTVWWSSGVRPGQPGLAVVLGHTKHNGNAVFNHLAEVKAGARIDLVGSTERLSYRVVAIVGQLSKSDPVALQNALTHAPAGAQLALITCTGDYNGHTTVENTVVFAAPA